MRRPHVGAKQGPGGDAWAPAHGKSCEPQATGHRPSSHRGTQRKRGTGRPVRDPASLQKSGRGVNKGSEQEQVRQENLSPRA